MSDRPESDEKDSPKPAADQAVVRAPSSAAARGKGADAELTPDDDGSSQLDPRNEEDLWQGRASWKSIYPSLMLWLLITLAVVIGIGVISGWKKYTLWSAEVCGVYLLYVLGRHVYRVWSVSYKLSTQRLFIRRGILTQTVDQTELMRVDDVKTRQTLIERMLRIGLVEVMSSDRSDTSLFLRHIEDPETVAEHIRKHTRLLQRRTLFMESLS